MRRHLVVEGGGASGVWLGGEEVALMILTPGDTVQAVVAPSMMAHLLLPRLIGWSLAANTRNLASCPFLLKIIAII